MSVSLRKMEERIIKAIGILSPIEVGKRTLVRRYVNKILEGSINCKLDKEIVNRNGLKFDLNMCEEIDLWLYFTGWWDKTDCQIALNSIKENGSVIDVGANIGSFALKAAQKTGPLGKVFAFEPNPRVLYRLNKNIALNYFDNIHTIDKALGDKVGEAQLFLPKTGKAGGASLHNDWLKSAGISPKRNSDHSISISIITLDDFCRDIQLDNLGLIKIDVEGSEPSVLLGAKETLNKFKPNLMLECNEKALVASGWNVKDLLKLIQDQGYRIFKRKLLSKRLWSVTSEKDIHSDCNLHCIAEKSV